MIILISVFILGYLGLFFFWPKGNVFYEVLHLPYFWIRIFGTSITALNFEKHHYGSHKRQYLLFCKSSKPVERPIIIVYFHGGAWRFGSPEAFRANAKPFIEHGYWVFLPSLRRTPRYNYTAIREDMSQLLLQVKGILQKEKIYNYKIILGGMSSGGNIAAHILYDRFALSKIGFKQSDFSGLFLCAAPLNLALMAEYEALRAFAGRRNEALFLQANPINHLQDDENTPVLCIHGEKDGLVEFESTLSFVGKLNQINPKLLQFQIIPSGTHLDAAKWAYQKDEIWHVLINWIEERE